MTCAAALTIAGGTTLTAAPAAQAATPVYLGAVGDVSDLSRGTGEPMAVHTYGYFTKKVPNNNASMITVRAPGYSWRQVAAASPGQTIYNDIVNWARTIKSRGTPLLLAYHHEPEAKKSTSYGSSADFVQAYRRVVTIFRQQGVTNVRWVWQMTPYAFDVRSTDRRYAPNWYPGDAYVDIVGMDSYAWSTCYGHHERYKDLQTVNANGLAFARAHGKLVANPEFGAAPDSRRAQWLANARQYIKANQALFAAVYYFNLNGSDPKCSWKLTSQPDLQAYGNMARDSAFRP